LIWRARYRESVHIDGQPTWMRRRDLTRKQKRSTWLFNSPRAIYHTYRYRVHYSMFQTTCTTHVFHQGWNRAAQRNVMSPQNSSSSHGIQSIASHTRCLVSTLYSTLCYFIKSIGAEDNIHPTAYRIRGVGVSDTVEQRALQVVHTEILLHNSFSLSLKSAG
jgi:hypothetical protein